MGQVSTSTIGSQCITNDKAVHSRTSQSNGRDLVRRQTWRQVAGHTDRHAWMVRVGVNLAGDEVVVPEMHVAHGTTALWLHAWSGQGATAWMATT
jgi:hypothetical protein